MFASGTLLTESQEKESVNASFQFQYVQYQIHEMYDRIIQSRYL